MLVPTHAVSNPADYLALAARSPSPHGEALLGQLVDAVTAGHLDGPLWTLGCSAHAAELHESRPLLRRLRALVAAALAEEAELRLRHTTRRFLALAGVHDGHRARLAGDGLPELSTVWALRLRSRLADQLGGELTDWLGADPELGRAGALVLAARVGVGALVESAAEDAYHQGEAFLARNAAGYVELRRRWARVTGDPDALLSELMDQRALGSVLAQWAPGVLDPPASTAALRDIVAAERGWFRCWLGIELDGRVSAIENG